MRIVFMGTPAFAAESLQALLSRHEVCAVLTQPDRPAGRGHKLQASEVKMLATQHGIPVLQPQTLSIRKGLEPALLDESKEIRRQLKAFGADVFVVAAYGLLLPKGVLEMPGMACINVHASLLPKYRGASPIHSALLNGDAETGITIMHMDTTLDTGDIVLQKALPIAQDERFVDLHNRMAVLGGEALLGALDLIENGTATRTPQDHSIATHSPLIKKTDGEIDWTSSSEKIVNMTRAFDPFPGCYTMHNGEVLKIWRAEAIRHMDIADAAPGTVVSIEQGTGAGQGIFVKTGDGAIAITELQAPGKKRMLAEQFLRGYSLHIGDVLLGVESFEL